MKIAILTESFLPHMNGVTGSVLQAVKHLTKKGHDLLIVAPNMGKFDADLYGARTELIRSVPFPGYPEVRVVNTTTNRIAKTLAEFGPDVVHLASPFVLGWASVKAADALQIPSVAVYQTDVTAYAGRYGIAKATPLAAAHIARLHRRATLTLAPSTSASDFLTEIGVDRLRRWGRGVDADRFAPERRSEAWRRKVLRSGNAAAGAQQVAQAAQAVQAAHTPREILVGYAGRLSPEKQVEDLTVLRNIEGIRLVIIGEGPSRPMLERLFPTAHFTGFLDGEDLARAVASLDVFVHPGESETFCQGVQESLACGVPVVATGRGGPVDLVESSVNGWLYKPGDLQQLRAQVLDLVGDDAKRSAFARAARASVRHRTWATLCDQLEAYYLEAIELRRIDDSMLVRPRVRPRSGGHHALGTLAPAGTPSQARSESRPDPQRWQSYVALGDSITEGIGDSSRAPRGEYVGWAARLGMLLATAQLGGDPAPRSGIQFANLAVRSRRVEHLVGQVDQALELSPDLVSVLIGANDLTRARVDIDAVANELERQVSRLREAGIEVLLGTPFLPRRALARVIAKRFAEFNMRVRRIAASHGCLLLDAEAMPEIGDLEMWSEDKVHPASRGHRALAYRAAAVLGVRDADALGALDQMLHTETVDARAEKHVSWLRAHALPWAWRRVRGRTAGDGVFAKHDAYIDLAPEPLGVAAMPTAAAPSTKTSDAARAQKEHGK